MNGEAKSLFDRLNEFETFCGCSGISIYSDNKGLVFRYIQCCLRNHSLCVSEEHDNIKSIIKLTDFELFQGSFGYKKCRRTENWIQGSKYLGDEGKYLWRGQSIIYNPAKKAPFVVGQQDFNLILVKGTIWKHLAFSSFSSDKSKAAGYSNEFRIDKNSPSYMLKLIGNKNLKGLFIENCSVNKEEKEFLLPTNSCFRVLSDGLSIIEPFKWQYEHKSGEALFYVIELEPISCELFNIDYSS